MKKAVKILICLMLAVCAFSIRSIAAEDTAEGYILTEREGKYALSVYKSGVPTELAYGSLTEALEKLGEGYLLIDGITVAESFDFPSGEYTVAGSLLLKQGAVFSVPAGTSLSLSDFTLTADEGSSGYLRVKGGRVSMRDSFVFGSTASAVRLDYSSTSELTLISTGISSASADATVVATQGNLYISGGYVKNSAGAALELDSGAYIYGSPEIVGIGYDIIAEKPLYLSKDGVGYSGGQLRVKYMAEFAEGTINELFYSANAESVSRILLFDKNGREYALTYFDTSVHTAEKSFAAVYLPYTVKIKDGSTTLSTVYKLAGELLAEPTAVEKTGYSFLGWYRDAAGNNRYDFSAQITSSTEIYAVYSLLPPTFSISSISFSYDGTEHKLSFDKLSHALDSNGGFYSYKWYKDGELISTAASIGIKYVSDSGSYSCYVTYNYSSDTANISAEGIIVTVSKRIVSPEVPSPLYYNGREQTPTLSPSSLYTTTVASGIDAGHYKIKYTLTDSANCCFENTDLPTLDAEYEILRAANSWSENFLISDIYIGAEIEYSAIPKFGSVEILYSLTEDGEYSSAPPTTVGTYYARASVAGTSNYTSLLSAPVRFSVLVERVIDLEVESQPNTLRYVALTGFAPLGVSLIATYDSGRTELVTSDRVSYSYQNGTTFRYGDTAVNLSFGGVSVALPVEVVRADYDITGIAFVNATLPYNGSYQTLSYTGTLPVGLDGIPLTAVIVGGGTSVGTYSVTVNFYSESTDYNVPQSLSATITVERAKVNLDWGGTEFIYDGTAKLPVATYVDVFGVTRYPGISGEAASAGTYTATAREDANYLFENPTSSFIVKRADYDFSGVFWNGSGFVYDGTEKTVTVAGLPEGVSALGYTDSKATDAGSYVATAALAYDSKNYNPPPTLSYEWRIEPAEYSHDGFSFVGGSFIFDGKAHYPTLSGEMPIGKDGIALEYEISRGVVHVSDSGAVSVTYSTKSKNYKPPVPEVYTVEIIPMEISVTWSGVEYTYDGISYAPVASASLCSITVSGAAVNAGSYTAVATADNTDYKVTNNEAVFVIKKAENAWIAPLSCVDIYEGTAPSPTALAVCGEAVYAYYSDEELKNSVAPISPGTYYVVATVPESENYLALSSSVAVLNVIAVVPVSLSVSLVGTVTAYNSLDENAVYATVAYNDGSVKSIPLNELTVKYQNADSPRVGDTELAFTWADLSARISVTVSRADYDMSALRWEGVDTVYDGNAKNATLTGLPQGVTVVEYIGNGAINAGVYTVSAVLKYDEINYNAPETPTVQMTVAKQSVSIPEAVNIVYDGEYHEPVSTSQLYAFESERAKNAGEYTLIARLTDSLNYAFVGDTDAVEIGYSILPRTVTVTVDGITVYIDGEIPEAVYTVTEGSIVEGDILSVSQSEIDGRIVLTQDDPNYELISLGGDIERIDRLSPDKERQILLIVSLVILIVIILITAIVMRRRIFTFFAILKCRAVNRRKVTAEATATGLPPAAPTAEAVTESPLPTVRKSPERRKRPPIPTAVVASEPTVTAEAVDSSVSDTEDESEVISEPSTDTIEQTILTETLENAQAYTTDTVTVAEASSEETDFIEEHTEEPESVRGSDAESVVSIDVEHADELITDSLARDLVKRGREFVFTEGSEKGIVNVDTLSDNFLPGDRVDVNILKKKSLVPYDTAYLKVLARGEINKALSVYANEFSLSAVKMLVLTGGQAVKVTTVKEKQKGTDKP